MRRQQQRVRVLEQGDNPLPLRAQGGRQTDRRRAAGAQHGFFRLRRGGGEPWERAEDDGQQHAALRGPPARRGSSIFLADHVRRERGHSGVVPFSAGNLPKFGGEILAGAPHGGDAEIPDERGGGRGNQPALLHARSS